MKQILFSRGSGLIVAVLAAFLVLPGVAWAHCDGLDGPVVNAARKALDSGNVNLVLPWVKKQDEADVRKAFADTLAVRKLSPQARELGDRYFFETVVRLHRAGEGEPYTGLKPAGRDLGPAIPAADRALEQSSADAVVKLLTGAMEEGVRQRFNRALALKKFNPDDPAAGREFVEAYVVFLHYVEQLHAAAEAATHGAGHTAGSQ